MSNLWSVVGSLVVRIDTTQDLFWSIRVGGAISEMTAETHVIATNIPWMFSSETFPEVEVPSVFIVSSKRAIHATTHSLHSRDPHILISYFSRNPPVISDNTFNPTRETSKWDVTNQKYIKQTTYVNDDENFLPRKAPEKFRNFRSELVDSGIDYG